MSQPLTLGKGNVGYITICIQYFNKYHNIYNIQCDKISLKIVKSKTMDICFLQSTKKSIFFHLKSC